MKARSFIAITAALLPISAFSQDAVSEGAAPAAKAASIQSLDDFRVAFSNLPEAERQNYANALTQAGNYFRQKRIFEALEELYKARAILENGPNVLNMLGACYVEFRDFDKARAFFEKSLALSPKNPSIMFNIAEIHFVTRQWSKSLKHLDNTLEALPENANQMREIVLFKKMLCLIKLERLDEAVEIKALYTDSDDSPFFYYAAAAFAFKDGKSADADRLIARARRIFVKPELTAPWDDTLIEFGYLQSLFGALDEELAE